MNDENERSVASAGSVAKEWSGVPIAWAAVAQNGQPLWLAYHRRDAEGAVVGMAEVVPLCRSPALTDAERAAVTVFASLAWTELRWSEVEQHAVTLAGLLRKEAGR
jgi:hypothetical protein